jgi:predicted acetyltransferase
VNDLPLRAVRRDDDEDMLRLARAVTDHFYEDEPDSELRDWLPVLRETPAFVVEDGDRVVGNIGSFPMSVSVPGGDPLPCAGITAVGVAQTHKRRGLLRRLMTASLDDAVERGQPVAALYASESAIYPRFGYGVTAPLVSYRIDTTRTRFLDPVDPRLVEPLAPADAPRVAAAVAEAVAAVRPGFVSRTAAQWKRHLVDGAAARSGLGRRRLVQVPGRGYAVLRVREGFSGTLPAGEVALYDLVAVDPEAEQALWQHVIGHDLVTTVVAHLRPPDDALPWLVEDRLRLGVGESAPLYARLLDVPRCLASRTATVADGLVLEVVDPDRDTGGRYRWDVSPEGSACTRTDAEPDLTVPVEALAAVWLGGTSATRLAAARRLEEHRPGAVVRLDRMTATEHAPWTPWEF